MYGRLTGLGHGGTVLRHWSAVSYNVNSAIRCLGQCSYISAIKFFVKVFFPYSYIQGEKCFSKTSFQVGMDLLNGQNHYKGMDEKTH